MNGDEAIFHLHRGSTALLVSVPHCGTVIPDPIPGHDGAPGGSAGGQGGMGGMDM